MLYVHNSPSPTISKLSKCVCRLLAMAYAGGKMSHHDRFINITPYILLIIMYANDKYTCLSIYQY